LLIGGLLAKEKTQSLGLHDGNVQTNKNETKNNERNNERNKVVVQVSSLQ
jgi:hypothetical protein